MLTPIRKILIFSSTLTRINAEGEYFMDTVLSWAEAKLEFYEKEYSCVTDDYLIGHTEGWMDAMISLIEACNGGQFDKGE